MSIHDYADSFVNKRVSYHHHESVGNAHYGELHPMKPHRLTLTHHLVLSYGLHEYMDVYSPRQATKEELTAFHTPEYIDFLSKITPENISSFSPQERRSFNIASENGDCPTFTGIYDFCATYTGSSLSATRSLLSGQSEIAINWSGGLHHAQKSEASGFCYVNDIVISVLTLLRIHPRVLYIDIDLHHGDGVQNAFYSTDRVCTLSFHKYGGKEYFFPGTGAINEIGEGKGAHYSLNVPLQDGITDAAYLSLFKTIAEATIQRYRPSVIVLQCGADSLSCDRLGKFNLSIQGHAAAVSFVKSFKIPLLVLGGGGYTLRNVARCWTAETAALLDVSLDPSLPETAYHEFFGPDYSLYPTLKGSSEDMNSKKYLSDLQVRVMEELRYLDFAPAVQMSEMPRDLHDDDVDDRINEAKEDKMKDTRPSERRGLLR